MPASHGSYPKFEERWRYVRARWGQGVLREPAEVGTKKSASAVAPSDPELKSVCSTAQSRWERLWVRGSLAGRAGR